MAAGAVWAIDIGNNSLKALRLTTERGVVEVVGFDNIQHGKILTGDNVRPAEKEELVALSLRKFVSNHNLSGEDVIISVPSQNSFARFVNLPPVEKKRIPEIVKFEAVQQIPFDINDVQWDWQLVTEEGRPETKVGIFAIKNEVVDSELEYFSRENIQVGYVQMVPMALYNYALYDRSDLIKSDSQAAVVINIGADNTDLVVCTKSTVWQRCILIGGNTFTKAIANTFKLNFEKAEKLKRTAPVSKYARQIFQAMRPVFTDLASEIQRSLGFYNSSNPNTKLIRIIALGGGTKLRGLLKYIQQTLQIPVERPDSFKKLAISTGASPAKFHENVCDFGIVYGLALQGLGLAKIKSNLLPRSIARSMAWSSKAKHFTLAAGVLLAVSLVCLAATSFDSIRYSKNEEIRRRISSVIREAQDARDKLAEEERKGSSYEEIINKELEPFKYRDVVPLLQQTIFSALPNVSNNPDPEQKKLCEAFDNADVGTILEVPRKKREQIFVTDMSIFFTSDIESAQFGEADMSMRSRRISKSRGREYDDDYGGRGGVGSRSMYRPTYSTGASQVETQEQTKPGFVVTITGYSPYEKLGELMDPPGVENSPDKWGFVTRLMHLDDVVDGNCPFELYKKSEVPQHFMLTIQPVSWDAQMPAGIGVVDVRPAADGSAGQVLIDPMTKEIIGRVAVLGADGKPKLDINGKPLYQVNDHWFILNAKFIWENAPQTSSASAVSVESDGYRATPVSGTRTTPQRTRTKREIKGVFED